MPTYRDAPSTHCEAVRWAHCRASRLSAHSRADGTSLAENTSRPGAPLEEGPACLGGAPGVRGGAAAGGCDGRADAGKMRRAAYRRRPSTSELRAAGGRSAAVDWRGLQPYARRNSRLAGPFATRALMMEKVESVENGVRTVQKTGPPLSQARSRRLDSASSAPRCQGLENGLVKAIFDVVESGPRVKGQA